MKRRLAGGVALFLAVAVTVFFAAKANCPLKTTCTPDILTLELAISTESASFIVDGWSRDAPVAGCAFASLPTQPLAAAIAGVWLDFPFIVAYVLLLFFYCRWTGEALERHDDPGAAATGRAFAWAAAVAGALDFCVENPVLLFELHGHFHTWPTRIKALASMTKWALAALIVLYLVASVVMLIRIRLTKSRDVLLPIRESRRAPAPPSEIAHP